jgi:hypothetical protein
MTAELEEVNCQQHAPATHYPHESNVTQFTASFVDPEDCQDERKIAYTNEIDPGFSIP